ncbi:MAG: hypothetical protein U1F77_14185 [Kiritimatiellia bacterium]
MQIGGNGYYTLPITRKVAREESPASPGIHSRNSCRPPASSGSAGREEGIAGIENILGTEDDPRIPAASCDLLPLVRDAAWSASPPGCSPACAPP